MQERRRERPGTRTPRPTAGPRTGEPRERPPQRRQAAPDLRGRDAAGWDQAAGWYDSLLGERGSFYHQNVAIPGALALLDAQPRHQVLDLGCGQGVFSRALAERGAAVTGVDASEPLVRIARQRSRDIRYHVGDARKLDFLPSGSFDAVACLLALQNMEPIEPVLAECARVLRPGGRLVIVVNHPCFRVPRQSGWGWDEERKLQYRRVDRYLTDLKVPIQTHPGDAPRQVTWTYHHPLSGYVRALAAAGLYVDALEEWASPKTSQPGERAQAENAARQEIPLFLALRAVKVAAPGPKTGASLVQETKKPETSAPSGERRRPPARGRPRREKPRERPAGHVKRGAGKPSRPGRPGNRQSRQRPG
ncbi:MAG: class I SAM-dependent methyltransferase [Chloroflexota bacterium]|nr:class I SAM-dependent methyltransferase [Chloroflexota bacterium]